MKFNKTVEVIIIGAGHAGISASYYLKKSNISHLVLEKGRIGESWRSLRWDSFALNTPNWMNCLPGDKTPLENAENFFTKNEFVSYLQGYVTMNNLPILENSEVKRVIKNSNNNSFTISFKLEGIEHTIYSKSVIVASGILNVPKLPDLRKNIGSKIHQIHASKYRNAQRLPKGSVLIVGSGQSGTQIAEDLLHAGKEVYLSTSKVGRVPRRYRGKDFTEWFDVIDHFNEKTNDLEDNTMTSAINPLMSGVGPLGHTISLQFLNQLGAVILGRLQETSSNILYFDDSGVSNIKYADEFSKETKIFIDDIIESNNIDAEPPGIDLADIEDQEASSISKINELNLLEKNISTIIWATGFTGNFKWLSSAVLDENNLPIHDNGISPIPGLLFIGFPWLRSRKSGIVYGMTEEAKIIVQEVIKYVKKSKEKVY